MKKVFFSMLCLLIVTGCGCNKKEEKKVETEKSNKVEAVANLKFGTASFYVSGEKTNVKT